MSFPPDNDASFAALRALADPAAALHVVVDASQIAAFVPTAEAYALDARCLFRGKPGEELEDVAPHVVHVPGDTFYGDAFLLECLTDGYAIAVETTLSSTELRRHLKRHLKTKVDGVEHYVKFYLAANFEFCRETVPSFDMFFRSVDAVYLVGTNASGDLTRIVEARP